MKKETFLDFVKTMSGKQKFLAFGLIALLTVGALGFFNQTSKVQSSKSASSLSPPIQTVATEAIPPQTGTPQLAKENIYAGSRLLATEDYGIAAPNPTPTP